MPTNHQIFLALTQRRKLQGFNVSEYLEVWMEALKGKNVGKQLVKLV